MKTSGTTNTSPLQRLTDWQSTNCQESQSWESVRDDLQELAAQANELQLLELNSGCVVLSNLMEIAICNLSAAETITEIPQFVQEKLSTIIDAFNAKAEPEGLAKIEITIQEQWGELLELMSGMESEASFDEELDDIFEIVEIETRPDAHAETVDDSDHQIEMMLAVLQQAKETSSELDDDSSESETVDAAGGAHSFDRDDQVSAPIPPASLSVSDELRSDAELRLAFLDDASRCLAEMEQVALNSETGPAAERMRNFCRQLHTLKGASATVELNELATYLHQLEAWIESRLESESIDDEMLLQAVDSVRQQISILENLDQPCKENTQPAVPMSAKPQSKTENRKTENRTGEKPVAASQSVVPAPSLGSSKSSPSRDTSVRVRAAQLDKLMDMLAELVVIRNRRETRVNDIFQQKEELTRCASRLRKFNNQHFEQFKSYRPSPASGAASLGVEPTSSSALAEIANDVTEVSRLLEDAFKPVTEENIALTHFIRQFRQELMQLSRLPVSGLFQRLNRAARDAGRAEGKSVKVHFVGEETGVEQTVQEKLFDPLLHMVRNCVSHGIEAGPQRIACGKTEHGNLTLNASASSSMLVVTISDDGKGLDFDAIRRRGYERGLLSPDSVPSDKQLAKLIFHPGFSTRDQASEISGRGIGMDVVATTLDQMRGRIEVESVPGSGTSMRICIPLATGIEHAMVFRAGSQLFALPMRSITSTAKQQAQNDTQLESLARMMNLEAGKTNCTGPTLMLDDRIGFTVTEILGPEEAVVRPLPALLQRHPLVSGAVLAGSGETVLMLLPEKIRQLCQKAVGNDESSTSNEIEVVEKTVGPPSGRALVVDDSLSARKSLAKRLRNRGMMVAEANDGLDAIEELQRGEFDFVFTDMDMPRMGGLELISEIKQNELTTAKIVVVSSRAHDEVWERVSELGAFKFMNKPVSEETLAEIFSQHFVDCQLQSNDKQEEALR